MICPKCNKEISNEDSFCPYCGATIPENQKQEKKYCNVCGFQLNSDDSFCPNCGSPAPKSSSGSSFNSSLNEELSLGDNNERKEKFDDLQVFVGNNKFAYYKNAFRSIENKQILTWNWCSFLFGPFWTIYRKVFLPTVLYIIGYLILTVVSHVVDVEHLGDIFTIIRIASWFLFGLFGNFFYYKKYQKVLRECGTRTGNERSTYLYYHGNTNVGFIFLLFGILFIFGIIEGIIWPTSITFDYGGSEMMRLFISRIRG